MKALYSKEDEIDITANAIKEKYLKNDFNISDIGFKYNGVNEVSYFTKNGTKIGNVEVYYKGNKIDNFDLIYNGVLTFDLLEFLTNNIILIVSLLLLFIILLRAIIIKKKSNL